MLGLRALQRASRATSELHRCASNSAILNHLGRYYNPEREEDKTAFRQLFHQALGADRPAPLTVENELLRRHNSSLPTLVGQRVYGRVRAGLLIAAAASHCLLTRCPQILRLERQHAWIDVGYKGPVKVTKAELSASNLVASRGSSGSRVSPQDFQIGDVLTFLIEETADAFGDTVLSSAGAALLAHCRCTGALCTCSDTSPRMQGPAGRTRRQRRSWSSCSATSGSRSLSAGACSTGQRGATPSACLASWPSCPTRPAACRRPRAWAFCSPS